MVCTRPISTRPTSSSSTPAKIGSSSFIRLVISFTGWILALGVFVHSRKNKNHRSLWSKCRMKCSKTNLTGANPALTLQGSPFLVLLARKQHEREHSHERSLELGGSEKGSWMYCVFKWQHELHTSTWCWRQISAHSRLTEALAFSNPKFQWRPAKRKMCKWCWPLGEMGMG